jgi:hemoglobin
VDQELPSTESAYSVIGGAPTIRKAVDQLYEHLLADADLVPYFTDVDLPALRGHLASLLTTVLGGPGNYDTSRLGPAHARLNITSPHYHKVCTYAGGVLFSLGAPIEIVMSVGETLRSLEPVIVAQPATAGV